MPTTVTPATNTKWTVEFDTLRREKLFRHPPSDHTAYPALQAAVQPHIESYNVMLEPDGLIEHAIRDIGVKVFLDGQPGDEQRNRLSIRLTQIFVERAILPSTNKFSTRNREIFPAECRERHATYRGKLRGRIEYRINDEPWKETVRELGQLPIMIKVSSIKGLKSACIVVGTDTDSIQSSRCHLEKLSPAGLVRAKEESEELGGYFIVNGIEKIIRMLIVSRRNYPMAITRNSFHNRGKTYTRFGVSIRSVRPDQTSQTNVLHYLSDGNVTFRFSWRKNEYLVPVMMVLKALVETNDREIFEGLVGVAGSEGTKDTFLMDRVELLLRTYKAYKLKSRSRTRAYLGEKFRIVLNVPEDMSDEAVGGIFLRKIVLPHLWTSGASQASLEIDKFHMLIFMVRKLYALVAGECTVDNPDTVQNQELLLGGHLFGMILKERLDEWLSSIRTVCRDYVERNPDSAEFTSATFRKQFLSKILGRTNENLGSALEYFVSTGNLVSPTGLDLQQVSGYTVVAEKINFYRFISHFRMVHRGSFFAELKTTTVRKLLPESWGFLCPVHTPDGSPCGLLNHLSHKCIITTRSIDASKISELILQLGVTSSSSSSTDHSIVVQMDGRILGWCSPKQAKVIADSLRYWKVEGSHGVPLELEIGYVPNSSGGQYPGIYLCTTPARMLRPVRYLLSDETVRCESEERRDLLGRARTCGRTV